MAELTPKEIRELGVLARKAARHEQVQSYPLKLREMVEKMNRLRYEYQRMHRRIKREKKRLGIVDNEGAA